MISSLSFIRRGIPAESPSRFNFSDADLDALSARMGQDLTLADIDPSSPLRTLTPSTASKTFTSADSPADEDGEEDYDTVSSGSESDNDNDNDNDLSEQDESMTPSPNTAPIDEMAKYNLADYDAENDGSTSASLFLFSCDSLFCNS